MPYVPTDWSDGVTLVDEAHLDHLEGGVVTADANASAALAALPAKEDKSAKGAVSGYAPLGADQKVPAANLPAVALNDLSFDGDWVAGTYQEGDVVVKDGVSFLCVGGPTTVAPDPTLWGSLGPAIPAVVNGKWLKGVGGAMVWSDINASIGPSVAAANTDLAWTAGASVLTTLYVSPGGGSLRSLAAPDAGAGAVVTLRAGAAFTIKYLTAGGGPQFYLRNGADVALAVNDAVTFQYDGSAWFEIGSNIKPVLDRSTSQVDVVNTTAETTLYSKLILAGLMGIDKMLRLTLLGDFLHNNASGDGFTFRVKLGATTIIAQNYAFNQIAGGRQPWRLEMRLSNLGAANSQLALYDILSVLPAAGAPTTGIGQAQATATTDPPFGGVLSGTAAVDTTVDQTLTVTGQWSAASTNNSWRKRYANLELI